MNIWERIMNMLTGACDIYPRARNRDPKTSHESAEFIAKTGTARQQHKKAASAVRTYPGLTSNELADMTGLDRYMLARRLPEIDGYMVVRGDSRRCHISGRSAITWWPKFVD